jgi:hypothetical protein
MKINTIKTDGNGYKLISANYVRNNKRQKPTIGGNLLFDYKNETLTIFHPSQSPRTLTFDSFKEALKFILSIR